jgi:hypothetical protein
VIKFVGDLRQVGGPLVSSTNKTNRHDITEILLKVALNTIKQTHTFGTGGEGLYSCNVYGVFFISRVSLQRGGVGGYLPCFVKKILYNQIFKEEVEI